MTVIEPAPARPDDAEAWDAEVLAAQARAHYMQSSAWARTRAGSPWTALRDRIPVDGTDYPVQLFARKAPLAGTIYHAARIAGVTPAHVAALTERARSYPKGVFAVKAEVFQEYDQTLVDAFEAAGWVRTVSSQYEHAVMVDLSGSLDEVSARFKKRARNSYRSAAKQGVTIDEVPMTPESIARMHVLIDEVRERTGGYFRPHSYFQRIWDVYDAEGQGRFFYAMHEGESVASAFVIRFGDTAWYKDAGSQRENPKLFAPYAMQWAIMQRLHEEGVTGYELANIPDPASWEDSDIRGLYVFKTAWAPEPVRYMPSFELPLNGRYALWQRAGRYLRALYTRRTKDAWY
ncbi:lipid II:glycine glycyltransferase FemX [Agrococcus jejuensis]|uniref:Acetyltransferase (GNAT) domain-containing protein n=1 Tax=Agrococcus jejuensis TaxID=399736 RepID=A0A1G8B9A4_9MICO|nr:peptidoglycan bridge formation glycyltransferase FemA/FemB family protein [Agrococcus jejuensis]SDH29829.1 Acetyltransferase (GNAT) domain-containing protein [Agrococcus jejuensis]